MVLGLMMKERILDFAPAEGTQQRVNFVDFLDHLGPTEPTLAVPVAAVLLVWIVLGVIRGIWKARLSPAFCAGGV